MVELPEKWLSELASQPETGMGYQIVTVTLKDRRRFEQVAVVEGRITQIRGRKDIPFSSADIAEIVLTHDKWDFNKES